MAVVGGVALEGGFVARERCAHARVGFCAAKLNLRDVDERAVFAEGGGIVKLRVS